MAVSRERAVELSHRIVERFAATRGLALGGARELVRNKTLEALLAWEKESDRIEAAVRTRLQVRARRLVEGSREWDLLAAEERERLYAELVGRGE